MTNNEIIEAEVSLPSTTEVKARIDDMLANRKHMIDRVKPMLIQDVDVYKLPGMNKESLGKPGAEKLAAIFALRASFKIDKETMEALGATAAGRQYVAYICTLTHKGEFAGEGRGATFIEWMRNSYRRVYKKDLPSLTEEERKNLPTPLKATGKYGEYEYWKLPEEPVFDNLALNKSIKMAQKSAFVDAVIRATGMSDLFTQDVEDMDMSMYEEEAKDKPPAAPEAPATTPPAALATPPANDQTKDAEKKPCDKCQGHYVKRKSAKGELWGCSNYPKCTSMKPIPADALTDAAKEAAANIASA